MKPQNITISGFMAYGKTEYIDFNSLGSEGLYLITGETGAGKTTIFDAITYALYGQPSGSVRSSDMLRSKYADIGVETYVELVFTCNDKTYKIRRSPKYERPKKSGTGTTTENATEVIECDGKILNSKELPVTTIVEEIIGLNKDQFTQIAMLAQGDFQKLLLAETKYKEMIFRHIFNTSNYNTLQTKVNDDFKVIKNKKDRQQESVNQYIQGIQVDHEDVLSVDVSKAKNDELTDQQVITLLNALIDTDTNTLKNLDKNISNIKDQEKENNQKLEDASRYHQNLKVLENNKTTLTTLDTQLLQATKQLETLKNNDPIISSLKETIGELKSKESEFDVLDDKQKSLHTTFTELSKLSSKLKALETSTNKLQGQLSLNQKTLESIKDVSIELINVQNNRESLTQELGSIDELKNQIDIYKQLEDRKNRITDKFNQTSQLLKSANLELTEKEILWASEQAGILANTLEEGKPCPVCGSTTHPLPASPSSSAPTQVELDALKKKTKEINDTFIKVSNEATEVNTSTLKQKETIEYNIKNLIGNYTGALKDVVTNKHQEVTLQINQLIKQEKELLDVQSKKKNLEEQVVKNEQTIQDNNQLLAQYKSDKATLTERINTLQKDVETLSTKLGYPSKDALLQAINETSKKVKDLEMQKENALKKVTDIDKKVADLKGQNKQIEEDNSKIKDTDISLLTNIKNEITTQLSTLSKQRDIIYSRLNSNKIALENISRVYKEMSDTLKEYQWMLDLNNTLNGNIKGGDKVTLETYIQQSYFDRIVNKANLRFSVMSNHQYELVRSIPTTKSKKTGLELDVIDHYNGSTRSVKSLSGGEKFKASLALALGLSDMIQESSEGVRIDCMFVDEGFGSLDDTSLNLAIDVLNELSEGQRMIGIISHVAELERKIDQKIIVEKDARGFSHARIEH